MKREEKNFNSPEFAHIYIKKHSKIQEKLGFQYAKKLNDLNFKKGMILDSGCGFGAMDIILAKQLPECEITGIDLSDHLLEHANQLSAEYNLGKRTNFISGDVTCLPFEENVFDVAFSINMVHWVNDPVKMLGEIRRVLKPDGKLVIKDLRYSWLKIFEDEIKYAFNVEKAANIISEADITGGSISSSMLWWEYEIY